MSQEYFLIVAMAALPITSLFYMPKYKLRLALISFIAFQSITWASTIVLEQLGIVEFPVREFTRATQGNFTINFLFIPIIFTWFVLLFPHKATLFKKALHHFIFISLAVWTVSYIAVYTNLVNFLKESLLSWIIGLYISFTAFFIACNLYIMWFSKKADLHRGVL